MNLQFNAKRVTKRAVAKHLVNVLPKLQTKEEIRLEILLEDLDYKILVQATGDTFKVNRYTFFIDRYDVCSITEGVTYDNLLEVIQQEVNSSKLFGKVRRSVGSQFYTTSEEDYE